jgi:hemolysin activation/secretion protein
VLHDLHSFNFFNISLNSHLHGRLLLRGTELLWAPSRSIFFYVVLAAGMVPVHAQQRPDAGTILRETERQTLRIPPNLSPRRSPQTPTLRPADEVRFQVQRFALEGVAILSQDQVQRVLQSYLVRDIGFFDLEGAMAAVAAAYEAEGWLARVQVPEQDVVDGVVTLQIMEARLGRIIVDGKGSPRLTQDRVQRTMTARQQRGQPLSLRQMERAVSVLADTPGAVVTAALAGGERDGETDIVVTVSDRDGVSGSVMTDNAGSRSTGAARVVTALSVDNMLGLAEQVSSSLMSSEGTRYGLLGASIPWGYEGWRVGASASALEYRLVAGSLASAGAQGRASTLSLRAQYPVLRTASNNINASFTLEGKRFDNEANAQNISSKGSVLMTATLSGDRTDALWGGGYLLWSSTLTAGRLDLSGNADNLAADQAGPRSDGGYAKVTASLARLQQITKATSLWLSVSGQASARNLDSSEKFSLGGASLIRGFPNSEATGDRGWLATVEVRHSLNPQWQVAAFVDHGQIWLNHDASHVTAASQVPNRYALSSAGLGLSFTPSSKMALRMSASQRLTANPGANPLTGADSDGTLARTRLWVSANWFF